mgnify:CR=1 FL=1
MNIDQVGDELFSGVPPLERRQNDRRECDLAAAVITGHGEWRARDVNIPVAGMSFVLPAGTMPPGALAILKSPGPCRGMSGWKDP